MLDKNAGLQFLKIRDRLFLCCSKYNQFIGLLCIAKRHLLSYELEGSMNNNNMTLKEMREEATHQHSTANELDILVSSTRQMNKKRDRDIERLHSVLSSVEEKLVK
ncbi:MAG: hypothetical protein ACJAWS_002093 [Oleiphilaceae bacterium]